MQEIQIHKVDIRAISDQPARFHNVIALGLDVSLIAGAIIFSQIIQTTLVYLLSVFLIGSRMRALMNLLHECSHNCLVINNKWLNDAFGQLFCALPILFTKNGYTESHMRHHLHFGDENKDPDMIRYRAVFGNIAIHGAKTLDEIMCAILNIKKFAAYAYLNPIRALISSGPSETLPLIVFWAAIVGTFTYFSSIDLLFLYWVVPYLTSFKIICYVAELAEHFGIYSKSNEIDRTRNMYVSRIAASLFWPHGDNYHLIHHLFPFVPGFHLAKVDAYLKSNCSCYASQQFEDPAGYAGTN